MVDMVQEVLFFVSETYAQSAYDSCRNVVHPSTSGSIMSLMCGPWGNTLCTAHRWFEYMGSTSNTRSPFDILYSFVEDGDDVGDGFVAHNPATTPCDRPVPVSYFYIFAIFSILFR